MNHDVPEAGQAAGRRMQCAGFFLALLFLGHAAIADEYADARAALVAAYQAQDHVAMVEAAEKALAARPEHPGARFNLALAHALNDDPRAAFAQLAELLADRVDFGADQMSEFAALKELPGWPKYEAELRLLYAPYGDAEVAATLDDGHFIPEGLAIDDAGRIFLGSIRKGLLVRDGEVLSDRQGHWSVFGMRFHEDGSLWFASAAVAQFEGVGDDLGKTGLFRIDPDSGRITRAAILPQHAEEQLLGDLVIVGDVIYTTDSLTGAIYRYDIAADAYSIIVEPGVLRSPQGIAAGLASGVLYVADYGTGLYCLDLSDPKPERMLNTALSIDYGIDGLYRYGRELIVVQNGIRPHRINAFRLDRSGCRVGSFRPLAANLPEFDEPTLGVVHGDDFYFVANSHWNRFDQDNRLPADLNGPIVLKLALDRD